MDQIQEQLRKPPILAGLAFLAGLLVGWFVIGWGIWPVKWVDAPVKLLRSDIQEDILVWAVNAVEENSNPQATEKLLEDIGKPQARYLLERIKADYPNLSPAGVARFDELLQGVEPVAPAGASSADPDAPALLGGEAQNSPLTVNAGEEPRIPTTLLLMCLVTALIAGVLVYLFFLRPRRYNFPAPEPFQAQPAAYQEAYTSSDPAPSARSMPPAPIPQAFMPSDQDPPVVQYMTTYMAGDDKYDDSFSIDSPTGEFLGECGVGISETIGNGESKKVSALEVWLFDKNDIQTVTKVLMSEDSYNDPAASQRLAAKGEPVLAEPGKHVVLETATLQLEARVVSMGYGQGGGLPSNSYFDQMSLELAVWPKRD